MEPDVALTDYGLAIECMVLAGLIYAYGAQGNALRFRFIAFFIALGVAALIGGTFHGFFGNQSPLGLTVLWPATLVAIGMAALALWSIGATLIFSERVANWVLWGALFAFGVYVLLILFSSRAFWIAIINYIPAAIFLFVALLVMYSRNGMRYLLVGVGGIVLTFIAATVQYTGISIHPRYFNHNALYHLIQAVALFLIYWTARVLVR
jgi:hypothetical protein